MKMTKYARTSSSGEKRHYGVYTCQGRDKLGKGFCSMEGVVKSSLDQVVAQAIRYHMEAFWNLNGDKVEGMHQRYRSFSTLTREIVEAFVADILVDKGKRVTVVLRMADPWKALGLH